MTKPLATLYWAKVNQRRRQQTAHSARMMNKPASRPALIRLSTLVATVLLRLSSR